MFPKVIDLTDFSPSEWRFDVGTMLRVLSLMWKTPHLPNRNIAEM